MKTLMAVALLITANLAFANAAQWAGHHRKYDLFIESETVRGWYGNFTGDGHCEAKAEEMRPYFANYSYRCVRNDDRVCEGKDAGRCDLQDIE